jgi:excisionase family DNA binding protein
MSTNIEPIALSPAKAAAYLSLSKRSITELIAAGRIVARKHGTRTLVETQSLRDFLASLPRKIEREPIVLVKETLAATETPDTARPAS